jgi:hypothetical protein
MSSDRHVVMSIVGVREPPANAHPSQFAARLGENE